MRNLKRIALVAMVGVLASAGWASAAAEWTKDAYSLERLNGVWGSGPNDVYVVGYLNGEMVEPNGEKAKPTIVPTSEPVNEGGVIKHFNGVTWTSTIVGMSELNAVWGSSANLVLAVGDDSVVYRSTDGGATWTLSNTGMPKRTRLYGVWGTGADNIYVVGANDETESSRIVHSSDGGVTWTEQPTGEFDGIGLDGIWGSSANDIYACGGWGTILHSVDGVAWKRVKIKLKEDLKSLWGTASDNIYVVGMYGLIYRYDGSLWLPAYAYDPNMPIYETYTGVWGSSASDVYVVGNWGSVRHFDGSTWSNVAVGTGMSDSLSGVWGSASDDVYAVGTSSFHMNGKRRSAKDDGPSLEGLVLHYWSFGTLTASTTPVEGEIIVDGVSVGAGSYSGTLRAGAHAVSFGEVDGYITPADQSVTVESGEATAEGVYAQSGTLAISTTPVDGDIVVDGLGYGPGARNIVVAAGSHVVEFGSVDGYVTPETQTVVVTAGETTTVVGTYEGRGVLKISTTPVSGEILVNGVSKGTSSVSLELTPGEYTVSFGDVEDYTAPASQKVTVKLGETTTVVGTYEEDVEPAPGDDTGTLAISTTPVSGEIFIDGKTYGTGTVNQELATGSHTVSFGDVDGYATPEDQTVKLGVDEELTIVGTYVLEDWLQKLVESHGCLALGGVCTALMLFGFFGLALPKQ